MSVNLLSEKHLEFLSLQGGCSGSSESNLVKMPHCWKSLFDRLMVFLKDFFEKDNFEKSQQTTKNL